MKFRKKPVVIEAFQLHPEDGMTRRLPPSWLIDAVMSGGAVPAADGGMAITTREGVMRADVNDWVIRGIQGELYPCKPDIFAATYEAVEVTA